VQMLGVEVYCVVEGGANQTPALRRGHQSPCN
jgi:hypothetical protein